VYGPAKHCINVVRFGAPLSAGLVPVFAGWTASIIWRLIIVVTALAVGTTVCTLIPKQEK